MTLYLLFFPKNKKCLDALLCFVLFCPCCLLSLRLYVVSPLRLLEKFLKNA